MRALGQRVCICIVASLLLGLAPAASAQTRLIDSLRRVVARPVPPAPLDTVRALALGELCYQLINRDLPAARRYGEQGLALARRIGFIRGESNCLYNLGFVASRQRDLTAAAGYFQALLRTASRPGHVPWAEAEAYIGLGSVATVGEQFAAANRYYRLALALATARQKPADLRIALNRLATLYSVEALRHHPPADTLMARAEAYARRLLRLLGPAPTADKGVAYNALSGVGIARQQPDSVAYYGRRAAATFRAVGDIYNALVADHHIAEAYLSLGRPADAAPLMRQTAAAAHAMGHAELEAAASEVLGRALLALGQPGAAYQAQARTGELRDSLQSAESREALARAEASFGRERQNRRIAELDRAQAAQRRQLLLAGAVLLALTAGGAAGGVLYARLRRSRAALATQNQALARARATQDRLYAIIGHDLRSPLTALHMTADLLTQHRTAPDPALLDVLATELRGTTGRVMGLLDNLLHWAAAQTDELRANPRPLAAAALLHETAALFGPAAQAGQVRLVLDLPPNLPPLLADRNMTLAVLRNLVSNALRAAPPGSALTLGAAPAPLGSGAARLALRVRDEGPGLDPARLAALQADTANPTSPSLAIADSAARRPNGTGLGLPLVRLLAARQGGAFALESAPGRGTTATLWLPVEEGS